MTLTYSLTKEDFLQSQLFLSTRNLRLKRRKLINWFIVVAIFALAGFLFFKNNKFLAYYFLGATVLALFLYPTYQRWFFKRHYKKYVDDNLKNYFNEIVTLKIDEGFVEMLDKTGQTKINIAEIDQITEIENYFYLKTRSNQVINIPKYKIPEREDLKAFLLGLSKKLNIEFVTDLNWKWR